MLSTILIENWNELNEDEIADKSFQNGLSVKNKNLRTAKVYVYKFTARDILDLFNFFILKH